MFVLRLASAPDRINIHLFTVAAAWTLIVFISIGYVFHNADQKTIATATSPGSEEGLEANPMETYITSPYTA